MLEKKYGTVKFIFPVVQNSVQTGEDNLDEEIQVTKMLGDVYSF